MESTVCVFRRTEKKYCLTLLQKDALLHEIREYLTPDSHGKSTVCSLYLDTPMHLLIRNSIHAGAYKEKLRLRCYGTPTDESEVFLEIKKKYAGVVYKRRIALPHSAAVSYLSGGEKPCLGQIMEEVDYAMHFYKGIAPSVLIACEREAWFWKENPNLRLTFDTGIRYRQDNLSLTAGSGGKKMLPDDKVLLEIKTDGAMPLWLSHALSGLCVYPISFSKYATAYRAEKGVTEYA